MNYFSHAYRFLNDPVFAISTGIPDWLSVVDRKCRMRKKRVEPFADMEANDPFTVAVARGTLQHLNDDLRFHESRAFVELSMELTGLFRDPERPDPGFRPAFLGHLLTELLLDDWLIRRYPDRIERYYELMLTVDVGRIEQEVNRMATRPTDRLAWLIRRFGEARVLSCYAEDRTLLHRLNQVMHRVGFEQLPDWTLDRLPDCRERVDRRATELLTAVE